MARCYQLVGVPASGKSTWVQAQDWASNCAYISTDKYVEAHAREIGSTYSQVFDEVMPRAVRMMAEEVARAREVGQSIIWDQTSVSVGSRRRKFRMLPDYEHIAVVFHTPDPDELARRLALREGKTIPDPVMQSMIRNFEMPSLVEGFKEIWHVGAQVDQK